MTGFLSGSGRDMAAAPPLSSIHYLRALAAVAVVESHATRGLLGQAGVDVFFVISGFIMWTITSRETAPRIFFQRRLIRIVPLYWTATLIMAFHQKVAVDAVVKSLYFIPFFGEKGQIWPVLVPGWTLNYEMFFYVLVGATLLLPRRIQLACLIVGLCSLSLSHPFVVWLRDPVLLTYTNPLVLEFLAGILIAEGRFRTQLPGSIGGFLLLAIGMGGFWFAPMQDPNDIWRFLFGSEGPSVRKRTVRNKNTDEIPTISTRRRRFCSDGGIKCLFIACNHGVQAVLDAM
jgi:exopolysaccharide production protein ExoZ